MANGEASDPAVALRKAFQSAGVEVVELQRRRYTDQELFLVGVKPADLGKAGSTAAALNDTFVSLGQNVLTTVRRASRPAGTAITPMPEGVQDERAIALRQLISARSRASETQPSLAYIPDASMNIEAVTTPRHHLIFGRRGTGKTALMLEAKRLVENGNDGTVWLNLQTYRHEPAERIFLYFLRTILDHLRGDSPAASTEDPPDALEDARQNVRRMLRETSVPQRDAARLIPDINELLKRELMSRAARLFVFLDDLYYVGRQDQPMLLDMMHACVRDADCWLKITSIRNLTKWFITSPPMGLETAHDADLVDLDVTLQDPPRAKSFLERVLTRYSETVGIPSLTSVFSGSALDRLTLASGGVPRDYLTLAGSSIVKTRERAGSHLVGVQDVNQAAGDAAQIKVQELEEDGAANKGVPEQASLALVRLRSFCLDETSYTYFRVRHEDRDHNPEAFIVLNRLVEFRLLHSVAPSISNPHKAGDASEVFMLDLSQYTGSRLKQKLWVLDLEGGQIVSKRTRDSASKRIAARARDLVAILRLAPVLELSHLSDIITTSDSAQGDILKVLRPGVTRKVAELVTEVRAPYRHVVLTLDDLVDNGVLERTEVEGQDVVTLVEQDS